MEDWLDGRQSALQPLLDALDALRDLHDMAIALSNEEAASRILRLIQEIAREIDLW